jgi:aromatic-L-amino-acid decarboxylase
MHGAGVFRDALDEKLDLARHTANELRKIPGIEIVAEPVLSLLAFRMRFPHLTSSDEDAQNRQWMSLVNQKQRVLLTGTTTKGRFLIRLCILSFRTHADRIEMALEDLRSSLTELQS